MAKVNAMTENPLWDGDFIRCMNDNQFDDFMDRHFDDEGFSEEDTSVEPKPTPVPELVNTVLYYKDNTTYQLRRFSQEITPDTESWDE